MTRIRLLIAAAAIAAFTIVPTAGPALASHTCGLDGTIGTICDNYHNPKPLLQYLICLLLPTC